MQRVLSNFSRKLSNNSNSSVVQLVQPQKHFTPLARPSYSNYNHKNCIFSSSQVNPALNFYSCQSHYTLSGKVHGFLSNPLLSKQFMSVLSNTHFRVSSKKLIDYKVRFLSDRFGRGFSGSNASFGSYWSSWRSWLHRLTPDNMVLGLILANVAVFMLWRIASKRFMVENFVISLDNLRHGRVHTLITSAFGEIDLGHLMSNIIGLYMFGTGIARKFGPVYLLKLYIAGAMGGSLFHLAHHGFMALSTKGQLQTVCQLKHTVVRLCQLQMDPSRTPGLSLSLSKIKCYFNFIKFSFQNQVAGGAVDAILLLCIFLYPRSTLYLYFIIPVPAVLAGIMLIGRDVLMMKEGKKKMSGWAHLGGAAVAALAYADIRKGRF